MKFLCKHKINNKKYNKEDAYDPPKKKNQLH